MARHWWREYAVTTYRDARDAWEAQAEAVALGYASELADFRAEHPAPTFKDTLIGLRQS